MDAFARDFQTDQPESFSAELAETRDPHAPDEIVRSLIKELGQTAEIPPDGALFRLSS